MKTLWIVLLSLSIWNMASCQTTTTNLEEQLIGSWVYIRASAEATVDSATIKIDSLWKTPKYEVTKLHIQKAGVVINDQGCYDINEHYYLKENSFFRYGEGAKKKDAVEYQIVYIDKDHLVLGGKRENNSYTSYYKRAQKK
ncbi:MAG: hypothetical protein GY810_02950 [Aureispira sp.]|nr:hypothetical protein [Aureispira sp.]